jgi:UPF0755 protein
MRRLLALLIVLGIIGAGVTFWAGSAWDQPGPAAANGQETVVLIKPRTPVHAIAGQLQDAHVIDSALVFEFNLRIRRLSDKLKAGEYGIPSRASMAAIAGILMSGRSIEHKLTAPEGLTSEMIWKLVKADPVLIGDPGPVPSEGTLLPETYLFTRGATRAHILDEMRQAQQKYLSQHWATRSPGLPFQNVQQAVTLASIVEKETALPEERRHIASVFVNRLKAGMKLQSDPTIIYGLTKGYPLGRGIRESEIAGETPYNTYVIDGLPPGPICNPGKDAIAAVLNPEQTDDLYFVATGKGGHVFSSSIAEHQRNVVAYRAQERLKGVGEVSVSPPEVTPSDTVPAVAVPVLPKAAKPAPRRPRRR